MAATPAAPAATGLEHLSDEELQHMAAQTPPLEHLSDEQLAGVAVQQGLMQEEQATQAVQEKKRIEREPVAQGVSEALAANPMMPVPAGVVNAMLTKGGRVGDVAAEVVAPLAGAVAGTMAEPAGGTIAGGAAGGAAGESLAQARQYFRGERDKVSMGAIAASTVTGGIPVGGRLLATPAKVIATRALQGGAIALTHEGIRQAIDEHKADLGGLVKSGALGVLFGGVVGSAESAITRRMVLKAVRETPEFKDFKGNDSALVQEVHAKFAREAPPPAEPKNVTPRPGEQPAPVAGELQRPAPEEPVQVRPAEEFGGVRIPEQPSAVKPLGTLSDAELLQVAKEIPAPEGATAVAPQGFKTAKGSTYQVDERGNTIRTKLSPGRGQGETDAPSPAVFVTPEVAEQIQQEGMAQNRIILREDGNQIRPSVGEDLRGRNIQIAAVDAAGKEVFSSPAATKADVGLHPFEISYNGAEKRYHLGNQITELGGQSSTAPVEVAPGEKVVAPASAQESAVAQLSTPKQIKVQKEFLLSAVQGAAANAVSNPDFVKELTGLGKMSAAALGSAKPKFEAKYSDFVTFRVPGDGTYRIRNIKEALEDFAAKVDRKFGKGLKSPEPKKASIPRMTADELAQYRAAGDVAQLPDGQTPRTAAMGTTAPRPSAGQQRVAAAETQARATAQKAAALPAAATTLAKNAPTAGAATWFRGLRSVAAPQTLDNGARDLSHILRAAFGAEYASLQRADEALGQYRKEFDLTPVPRTWAHNPAAPLPRNYEVMRRIDTGQLAGLTPAEQAFATTMRGLLDRATGEVQSVSPHSLQDLYENYFPRLWRDPEKNANKLNQLMTRRPLEGSKSFLKQRSLQYFTDGLELGLVPVSDNPVDVTLAKLGEMARFTTTRRAMVEARRAGLRKFKYVYEPMPEGWRAVDDPSSDVWKPPTVTIQEAFDEQLRVKTLEMLESLGISHERLVKLGGKRWGDANEATGIRTKFGGPDAVFWHEAGHMLDWRYPELRGITGAMDRGAKGDQMRALSDLRFEGQKVTASFKSYTRKTEEKIANMFDAYIRAPEKFQAVAPDVFRDFKGWLAQHPEVQRPLDAIKPSLRLGSDSKELFVGGPIKLGDWIMPEGAAQVMDNYLQPGLGRFAVFRGLRDVSGLANGAQLLGFFHGQFVMNDSFYSGLGMALYDALNGKPVRAAKELLQTPISPATSWWRGRQIQQAIRDPAAATTAARQIAQMAIDANLRAGHGPNDGQFARQWTRAVREMRQAPNTGAAWEALWRAPFAGIELALAPIMRGLVPPMKLGIFARMAERVAADNPGANVATIRAKMAEAADATEDRLGQVTYDNLFQNRVLKDAAQLALRAYGWQLTKYRMIAGGAADWGRAARDAASGKKPKVTFRMSYLPAMVIGHAILGATLQYMLTGKPPQNPMDYLFPDTGLKDKLGRPVRVSLADFVKDIAADWRTFPNLSKMGSEWTHKLAPFWNIAAEMYQNRDFWGTQIFSDKQIGEPELDHLSKNIWEGVKHLALSAAPFSARAGQKFADAGANPSVAYTAPLVGFVPAPRYAVETPMQNFLSEQAGRDQYVRTQDQAERSQVARDISAALRERKPLTPDQQKAMRTLSKDQLTNAARKAYMDPDVWAVRALDLDRGMQAWDLASDKERQKITPTLRMKIMNGFTAGQDPAKLKRYLILVNRVPAEK